MPQRDAARFRPNRDSSQTYPTAPEELPVPQGTRDLTGGGIVTATESSGIALASVEIAFVEGTDEPTADETPAPVTSETDGDFESDLDEEQLGSAYGLPVPITESYLNSIPPKCVQRMLEFERVRREYHDTFQKPPSSSQLDQAPRLALEDIVDQASLNSRELQTQKESLYRVALVLSLERFDYQLKPSVGGNNTAVDYTHNRFGGETVNRLAIPTNLQIDRMLYTGGNFLARFANTVVLTFNGPEGFAADVGSELLFDISQTVFQHDIRLEGLTQAERDVVYAAREFARFRRELFVNLANEYYALIRRFRQVEINSQNYFTLVREFNQNEAEYRAGLVSRIELDQIEQQVINGRRILLSTCNDLENSIDDLKITIGLPTEEPLNIDLAELQLLTLRDELAVTGELIERGRKRLVSERNREFPAQASLLSAASVLVERMRNSVRLRELLGEKILTSNELLDFGLRIQTDAARLDVDEAHKEMQSELESESPSLAIVFQRRMDVVNERLEVLQFQLQRVQNRQPISEQLSTLEAQTKQCRRRASQLGERFDQLITDLRLAEIPQLLADSVQLEKDTEALVEKLDIILDSDARLPAPDGRPRVMIPEVDELLRESESYLVSDGGLMPIEIDMDEAMMTALVRRFDLINERGFIADDWRQIKFAADDLKSILNLRATQSIRTRNGVNRVFDFTLDDSTTTLTGTFDAPFNRRAQRNLYRGTLINYQASLRRLALLEDNIKLSVRRDVRALSLNREQYVNDIASAALAYERVVSTELELRLGVGSVAARDFLESQNAYVSALSNVADRHILYISDRLRLFLDLELLDVGENGFWDQLYDDEYQPMPFYQFPRYAVPAYGRLHPCLKYSPEIRQMLCVPTGTAGIHDDNRVEVSRSNDVLKKNENDR